jgi:hypothetical protein
MFNGLESVDATGAIWGIGLLSPCPAARMGAVVPEGRTSDELALMDPPENGISANFISPFGGFKAGGAGRFRNWAAAAGSF